MTPASLTPLARAVVMNSACRTPNIPSRISLATRPAKNKPSVMVGKTACKGESHIAQILLQKRFVQVVLPLERLFDLLRRRGPFAIKRAAGCHTYQHEGEKADDEHQRH